MAIRAMDILQANLRAFGEPAIIDDKPITVGFNEPGGQPDPYLQDPGMDDPTCMALRDDLEAIGQWPLVAREIEIDGKLYRILRHPESKGAVNMVLRLAE